MATTLGVEKLADAIRPSLTRIVTTDQHRRVAVAVYQLLADGNPVPVSAIANRSGTDSAFVEQALGGWPGVFRGEDGNVIGFWGLAVPEMAHRFHAQGGKPIYAWCALDPFLIVPVIQRTARVESTDPVTAQPITMTVTPDGVEDLSPASAVVSLLAPDKPFDRDVIQTFCHFVLNFASRESAHQWASGREHIVVFPVTDAFEVGRRAWSPLHT